MQIVYIKMNSHKWVLVTKIDNQDIDEHSKMKYQVDTRWNGNIIVIIFSLLVADDN